MYRFLLVAAVMIGSLQLIAQSPNTVVGGQFSTFFRTSEGDGQIRSFVDGNLRIVNFTIKENRFTYRFNPYLGRRISRRMVLGVGGTFGGTRTSSNSDSDDPDFTREEGTLRWNTTLGGFGWMRYRFLPDQKFGLFLEPRLGYEKSKFTRRFGDGEANVFLRQRTWYFDVVFGINYAITDRFLVNARLASLYFRDNKTTESSDNLFLPNNRNSGLGIGREEVALGVEWRF